MSHVVPNHKTEKKQNKTKTTTTTTKRISLDTKLEMLWECQGIMCMYR